MLGNLSQTDRQSQIAQSYDAHFNHLREVYDRVLENHNFESLIVYSGDIKKQPYKQIQDTHVTRVKQTNALLCAKQESCE